jgi:hypothetical protein
MVIFAEGMKQQLRHAEVYVQVVSSMPAKEGKVESF